jgi:hypothetical protein
MGAAGPPEMRVRALNALGMLVERPLIDPCGPDRFRSPVRASPDARGWERRIRPLTGCGETLTATERDRLALKLSPLLFQPDEDVVHATAQALGKLGASGARGALTRLLKQRSQEASRCQRRGGDCSFDAVRESARAALRDLERFRPARAKHHPWPAAALLLRRR